MHHRRILYSTTCGYAIRAVIFLARHPEGAATVHIASECGLLSPEYVGDILNGLVKRDLLCSATGRGGGFFLERDPADICLADIVQAIDGEDRSSECAMGYPECPLLPEHTPCELHQKWQELKTWIRMYLRETTIAELAQQPESARCAPLCTEHWECA